MIGAALAAANVVLAPIALGIAVARWLRVPGDRLFLAAFALWAGAFALALLYFVWLALGLDLEAFRFVPLPLGVALAWTAPPLRWERPPAASVTLRATLAFTIAVSLLLLAEHALRGSMTVVVAGDEAAIWAGKAKAVFVAGGFGPEFVGRVAHDPALYHPDYPMLNPLLQLFTFANAGAITHLENRLPIFMGLVALVLLAAAALRRCVGPGFAAIGVLLIVGCAAIVEECENACADGLVALGLLAALECHARLRAGDRGGAAAFGLALAFLAWTKNEGAMLALAVAAGALADAWLRRERLDGRGLALWLGPAVVVLALQLGFNAYAGASNDLLAEANAPPLLTRLAEQAPTHAPQVAAYAWRHGVLDVERTNGLVAMFALLALALPRAAFRAARAGTIALLLGACGYLFSYLVTPHAIAWQLEYSIDRILFQLTPACALLVATICAHLLRPPALPPGAPQRQNATLPSR